MKIKATTATLPIHKWKFTTRSPSNIRLEWHSMHLPPGHRYGYRIKSCSFHSRERYYKVYCMCGWSFDKWGPNRQNAFTVADLVHYKEITKQLSFMDMLKKSGKIVDGGEYFNGTLGMARFNQPPE